MERILRRLNTEAYRYAEGSMAVQTSSGGEWLGRNSLGMAIQANYKAMIR